MTFGKDLTKINEAVELFKQGWKYKDLAAKYGVTTQTIGRIFKKYNIKEPDNYKWVNSTYFDIIDTEEKAYLLGFFIADGCVREEFDKRYECTNRLRMCLSNSIDDKEIIELLHKKICPNNKLLWRHNTKGAKNRKPQLTVQWTSNHMSNILINKYKILPKKTYDLNFKFPFETIPESLHRHFIRGFIDGDGAISLDGLRFCFNSELFLEQIMNIFINFFKNNNLEFHYTKRLEKGKTVDIWKAFIAKGNHEKQQLLKDFLYKDATVYLTRKYNKIQLWKTKKIGRPKKS